MASTKFTVDATGNTYADGTLGVKGVSTLQDDLLLSEDAAVIKHSVAAGSTTAGLSILSEHYHVDVESVRFTDAKIGTTTDADLITLADNSVSWHARHHRWHADCVRTMAPLKLPEDAAVIKHTADVSTTAGLSTSARTLTDVESRQMPHRHHDDAHYPDERRVAVAGTLCQTM